MKLIKFIKHVINVMFLWSIPFILLAFFLLITGLIYNYPMAVTSDLRKVVMLFYFISTFVLYVMSSGKEDNISIIKV